MKKLYTIAVLLFCLVPAIAQEGLPGYFQITVTDLPGATTNRMQIQVKPISSVVPLQSMCNGSAILTDIVGQIKFAVRWPVSSGITDVTVNNLGGNNFPAECPDIDPAAGYFMAAPAAPNLSPDGLTLIKTFQTSGIVPVPMDWILNNWIEICTLNLVGGNCTVCEIPDIYAIGDYPTMEAGLDLDHVFSLDHLGGGTTIEYNMAPNNAPLPLNLLAFTADKSGTRDALVSWTTANEENTSHFKIQRSFDKKNWYDAGSVAAAGYSIEVRNYTFMDYQVYNGRDARLNVYYRLSMVDLDGRTKFSPMQTVVFGTDVTKGREFVVYPNPASDGLQVEWDANRDDQPTTLEFFDISGKLVYSQVVSENTNQEYVDFGHTTIQPGLYLLRILNGEEALDHKQIVVGRD